MKVPQLRVRAFRMRRGEEGILEACTCCYPLERYPGSETGHDDHTVERFGEQGFACQAHAIILSARKVAAGDVTALMDELAALENRADDAILRLVALRDQLDKHARDSAVSP